MLFFNTFANDIQFGDVYFALATKTLVYPLANGQNLALVANGLQFGGKFYIPSLSFPVVCFFSILLRMIYNLVTYILHWRRKLSFILWRMDKILLWLQTDFNLE